MNYIMALLGFLLYIGLGMMKTKAKYINRKFSYLTYLKDEILKVVVSALAVIILIIGLPEVVTFIFPGYSESSLMLSACIGFLNYAVFDKVIGTFVPKNFVEK